MLIPETDLETVPVLVPLALPAPYDYLVPEDAQVGPGSFVVAPLGPVKYVAAVWRRPEGAPAATVLRSKLRALVDVLDDVPPLPAISMDFAEWVAGYTLAPPGMVLRMMMSASTAFQPPAPRYGVRLAGPPPERMTPARTRVLETARNGLIWVKSLLAEAAGVSPGVIDGLVDAGTLVAEPLPDTIARELDPNLLRAELTAEQTKAAERLLYNTRDGFAVSLLDGVTGSGKTEVYFQAIAETLARGKQALVMIPEIALTSAFIARCEQRFGARPTEWHSGLTQSARGRAWRAVAEGRAQLVVGARSALFLPFPKLGLIVVDEEHDQAYKQEDRVSYQARDMAVVRGHLGGCPVILSSATPSIESWVNADQGRYRHVPLRARYKAAGLPDLKAIDMRKSPPERGSWLSPVLTEAMAETLARGEQSLLFLNRRGYAPLTLCRNCGYRFECPNCSAWMVEHRFRHRLECHHCGKFAPIPEECPACGAEDSLVACGPGVERIAEEVGALFPEARRAILSSDMTPRISDLRETLREIEDREVDIVIGTQLVAKGHHFPGLALVGVVDSDLGLAQGDPRAAERTFQLLSQVTGRAGRETIAGRGLLQTYMPEHPVIEALISGDRDAFYEREIAARREAGMPPFGRLASLLISGTDRAATEAHSRAIARAAPPADKIKVLGPAEAPLSVVRGRYRYRILVKAPRENDIQAYLRLWITDMPKARGSIRLSIDIDPYTFL